MDFRSVLSHIGVILEILGILILIPVIFAWVFGEPTYMGFFIGAIISFFLGTLLDKKFRKDEINLSSAMLIAAISFVLVSLIGAIPFLPFLDPVDAVFESASGFTTTGLTVVDPESLPLSLLFWRSFTQWIGGIGILLIFVLLVNSPGTSSYYLYKVEGNQEKIEASVRSSTRSAFKIYGTYTVIGLILLSVAGMPLFDSLLHTFTSVSTGGFSTKAESIGYYNSFPIEAVILFMMLIGGTSFFIHDKLLRRKLKQYIYNPETQLFLILVLSFTLLLSFSLSSFGAPIWHGLFHAFSAITTTGFSTVPVLSSGLAMMLILILMLVGGYAGSTAGGIKLIRAGIIIKAIPWIGKRLSLPEEAVVPFRFGKRTIKESEVAIITLFIALYFIILVLSTMGLVYLGYPIEESFFQTSSAQGTVGFSALPMDIMHPLGKVILMVNMFLGRLEIFPYLVMIYIVYHRITFRSRQ
jgi:trk system potassium uptake protein TrkH